MYKKIVVFLAFIITVVAVQFGINDTNVSAVKDANFYSLNNILFFDEDAGVCNPGETLVESDIKVAKSPTTDAIFSYLTKTGLSTNGGKPLSDVQAAGIMGNMYAESGMNPAAIEDTDREQKGHGLVQWTFGRWDRLSAYADSKGKDWTDLTTQLEFLKSELEGSEKKILSDSQFKTTDSPAVAAMRFRIIFERADPAVAHDDRREGAAASVFSQYAKARTGANCKSGNGIIAGDIVKTAIALAITKPATEGMNKKSDATPAYQQAKEKWNPGAHWTDCGGFVAVVMRSTGVDPNFELLGTDLQMNYIRSHPEKYAVNENPTRNSLEPGDLMYTSGHVVIYTGAETYPAVDASWHNPDTGEGGRIPSVRGSGSIDWMMGQGMVSVRVIK